MNVIDPPPKVKDCKIEVEDISTAGKNMKRGVKKRMQT